MTKYFDPSQQDDIVALAALIDRIVNSHDELDVRFALIVWQDFNPNVGGLISNDSDNDTVIEMLDNAKRRISHAEGTIHKVHGHA